MRFKVRLSVFSSGRVTLFLFLLPHLFKALENQTIFPRIFSQGFSEFVNHPILKSTFFLGHSDKSKIQKGPKGSQSKKEKEKTQKRKLLLSSKSPPPSFNSTPSQLPFLCLSLYFHYSLIKKRKLFLIFFKWLDGFFSFVADSPSRSFFLSKGILTFFSFRGFLPQANPSFHRKCRYFAETLVSKQAFFTFLAFSQKPPSRSISFFSTNLLAHVSNPFGPPL